VTRVSGIWKRLRSQRGFTLIELMVATSIGSVVMLATFATLDSSVKLTGNVTERVDSTQRARLAMDRITRELRSQVCPAAGTTPIVAGDDYSVTFYSFTGNTAVAPTGNPSSPASFRPDKHKIYWDTNSSSIKEDVWQATGTSPNWTWPSSVTKTILTDVKPPAGTNVPIFKFYSGEDATQAYGVPLTGPNAAATTLVKISFLTYPVGRANGQTVLLQDQVLSRTADPNGTSGTTVGECA
jgi:prepilin-type N-terminal cleavage/methylation domain-containing protein